MTDDSAPPALPFPFRTASRLDPPPEYRTLRETAPVRRIALPSGRRAWLLTRYDDIVSVARDPRFRRNPDGGEGLGDWLSVIDPPDSVRLRRVLQPILAPAVVEERWRARAEAVSDALLARMIESGPPADLVADYAWPLSCQVIFEIAGVGPIPAARLRHWIDAILAVADYSRAETADATTEIDEFLTGEVDRARRAPREDGLGAIVAALEAGTISHAEAVNLARSLLAGAVVNTVNLTCRGVLLLLRDPGQYALLRAEPARVPAAVREILRYSPTSGTGLGRTAIATRDVVVSGTTIAGGETVVCPLSAANHDPAVFADPDRFDITRDDASAHVAFGRGAHACLGAALATMEIECMISGLTRTFPSLRPARPADDLDWTTGIATTKLNRLPVSWESV